MGKSSREFRRSTSNNKGTSLNVFYGAPVGPFTQLRINKSIDANVFVGTRAQWSIGQWNCGCINFKRMRKQEEILGISLSKSEAKGIIKRNIIKEWQHRDTANTGWHLYAVQQVGTVRSAKRSIKEENIITSLRVGHTTLNKTLQLINKGWGSILQNNMVHLSKSIKIKLCLKPKTKSGKGKTKQVF